MKHTSYFLITPKAELISRLQETSDSGLVDLMEPVMWSGAEHDKSRLQHSDVELLAKILFLDTLLRERNSEVGFKKAFVDLAITENYFNSLWTLQRTQLDMSIEIAIEDAVASGTIDSIGSTGNERVDELLAFYRANRHRSDAE